MKITLTPEQASHYAALTLDVARAEENGDQPAHDEASDELYAYLSDIGAACINCGSLATHTTRDSGACCDSCDHPHCEPDCSCVHCVDDRKEALASRICRGIPRD